LHDVAPRLARARDERRWEIVPEGGDGEPGSQWATLLSPRHHSRRCRRCGGEERVMNASQRIEVGLNRGVVTPLSTSHCERCGAGMSSNYRQV
jgi:hypothetical protein